MKAHYKILAMFCLAGLILAVIPEQQIIKSGRYHKTVQQDTFKEVGSKKLKLIKVRRKGTIAQDFNNPGCLRLGNSKIDALAIGYGMTKNGKFLVFDKPQDGFSGLFIWIESNGSLSLKSAITKFAPHFENDTQGYINDLCATLGCKSTTKLKDINIIKLSVEISKIEGYEIK